MRWYGLLLGAVLLAPMLLGLPAAAQPPRAERPSYSVGDTWVRTDGVYELKALAGFSRIQSERVVLLLDTCYSGTAGGRTFARQQLRSSNLNDHFLERLTRSKGRVIITAAGPNEVALETSELGHGVFTYYLLEGSVARPTGTPTAW